jgi:hypothetical protein
VEPNLHVSRRIDSDHVLSPRCAEIDVLPEEILGEALSDHLDEYRRIEAKYSLSPPSMKQYLYDKRFQDWENVIQDIGEQSWLQWRKGSGARSAVIEAMYHKGRNRELIYCSDKCDKAIDERQLIFAYCFFKAAQSSGGIPTADQYLAVVYGILGDQKRILEEEMVDIIGKSIGIASTDIKAVIEDALFYRYMLPYISFLREGHAARWFADHLHDELSEDLGRRLSFFMHPLADTKGKADLVVCVDRAVFCAVGVTMSSSTSICHYRDKCGRSPWKGLMLPVQADTSHNRVNTVTRDTIDRNADMLIGLIEGTISWHQLR